MTKRRYPRLGALERLRPRETLLCDCCSDAAVTKLWIQVSWFRGDDEVILTCGHHRDLARKPYMVELYKDLGLNQKKLATK